MLGQEQALPHDLSEQDRSEQDPADRHAADGITDAAADEISAALKGKIRAIITLLLEEARDPLSEGTKLLRSRVRVHCSVRHVAAKLKTKPTRSTAPAGLLEESELAPKAASATLESCTIKLLQVRTNRPSKPAKRPYSIELPQPGESTP